MLDIERVAAMQVKSAKIGGSASLMALPRDAGAGECGTMGG
jgi:hypothetical protein